MSKNNNFSDTSASRYSLALYELANEEDSLNEVEANCLQILRLISKSQDFNSFIKDPTNKIEVQLKVLEEISKKFNFNRLVIKFVNFLVIKRRFFYIEKIFKEFFEICLKKRGEIKAELIAAKNLTEEEIIQIKDILSQNFGSKIKLNYKNDPSLIGGLIIQVGSTMVDTSIRSKLQLIENKMIEA